MSEKLTKKKYEESQKVKDAFKEYSLYRDTQKPADYSFSDPELLADTQQKYMNPDKFSYDVETDPLYNQYKNIYQKQGKDAMEDSIGNISSLTGGYSNSYAQTVGLNAYNDKMDKLNSIIPELYSTAYSHYENELDRLENRLDYLSNKDKTEYLRYLDSYKNYTDELDSLRNMYLQESKNDISIQDSDWEAAYKLAMAEQDKQKTSDELAYKYFMASQDKAQFDAEMAQKQYENQYNNYLKEYELRLEREKLANQDAQFWANFNEANKDSVKESDLYSILGSGDYYSVLAALDYNYDDDEMVKYRALAMGIDKDYVDSYIDIKYKNGSKGSGK